MRFHVGFSKKISLKTLVFLLGSLFVGLLAFFGLIDNAYAETWTPINYNQFTGKRVDYLDTSSQPQTSTCTGLLSSYPTSNNSGYCLWRDYYGTNKYRIGIGSYNSSFTPKMYGMLYIAQSNGYILSNRSNSIYTQNVDIYFNNTSTPYCNNTSTDLKSINFKFYVDFDNWTSNYDFFNMSSNVNDLIGVSMSAYDDTTDSNIRIYTNACTIGNYLGRSYEVTCNNIFGGNANYNISYYSINFINKSPFNDRYSASNEEKSVIFNPQLTYNTNGSSGGYKNTLEYSCSDDDPIFDPICEEGECDDDPTGLNDIYDKIKGELENENYPLGINEYLSMPSSISDLATLPLVFLEKVFQNGDNQCSNYELDFTSIANNWLGHGYNTNSYKIKLPCMRNILSTYFGSLYDIADILLSCLVFYSIAKHIFVFMDLITEGEDLYSYYFTSGDDDDKIGGHKANAYVNHKTGEVSFK